MNTDHTETPELDQTIADYRKDAMAKGKDDFAYYFGLCGDLAAKGRQLEKERNEARAALATAMQERDEAQGRQRSYEGHLYFQVTKAKKALGKYSTKGHVCDCRNACQSIVDSAERFGKEPEELNALRARNDALTKALGDLLSKTCQRSSETLQVEMDDPLVGAEWKFQAAVILNARRALGKEGL